MKKQHSPLVVGAFVIGAAVVGFIALLSFGGDRFFGKPIRFVVVMENVSTSGLDPGSAVKLSGVRIGRVESVRPKYLPEKNVIAVRVTCEVDENRAAEIFPYEGKLEDLIRAGLNAKLRFAGITGLLYLDLSIDPDRVPDEILIDEETGQPIVPTAPDTIAEFTDALVTISTRLAEVDFKEISHQLTTLLATANTQLENGNIAETIQSIRAAADSIRVLAENENLTATFASLNETAGDLNAFMTHLKETTPELTGDLQALLAEASNAMQGLQDVTRSTNTMLDLQSGLPAELALALDRMQRAAAAIERLANYVERNPSAIIRGRAETPDQ
jgi:paraquat-inducible protein B